MTQEEAQAHLVTVLKYVEKAVGTYDELTELRKSFNCIKNELLKINEKPPIDNTIPANV